MSPEHIKDREGSLQSSIERFIQNYAQKGRVLKVDPKELAANICTLYDRYAEEVVRPTIRSKIIQNYKIIANTELAILRVAPFSTEEDGRKLNAQLAQHVALNFLIDWNTLDETKAKKLFTEDSEISSFLTEHSTWLQQLDTRFQFPIFSNSQVWRLFYYLLRDRIKQL